MSDFQWGDNPNGPQHPTDQDERPLSTFAYVFMVMTVTGQEGFEGADTAEDLRQLSAELDADPEVYAYIVYQKVGAKTKDQSRATDRSGAAGPQ